LRWLGITFDKVIKSNTACCVNSVPAVVPRMLSLPLVPIHYSLKQMYA